MSEEPVNHSGTDGGVEPEPVDSTRVGDGAVAEPTSANLEAPGGAAEAAPTAEQTVPGGPIPWRTDTEPAAVASSASVAEPTAPAGASDRRPAIGWKHFLAGSLVGALVGGAVAGGVYAATNDDGNGTSRTVVVQENQAKSSNTPNSTIGKPTDVQGILRRVEPAVVAIRTGSAASDVFNNSGSDNNGGGAGSGFVVSPDGLIVTNNHVIEDAAGKIEVAFTDGTVKKAKVLGHTSDYDLAVLKVDAKNLPTATLGSSDAAQVGDSVVAIGNALALEGGLSVTEGIISAKGRTVDEPNGARLFGALQTDAAINPGNSGGPLVNARGQVVGINTAIVDSSQNVGFAISIDSARDVIAGLEKGHTVKTPLLGVRTTKNSPALERQLKLSTAEGVVLVQDSGPAVSPGSGAAKAGMKENDVILAIDGTKVSSPDDVAAIIRRHRPGDTLELTVNRAGKVQTIKVTLGAKS